MDSTIWEKIVSDAGEDYELSLYDRNTMLTDNSVWSLVLAEHYRAAVERWTAYA